MKRGRSSANHEARVRDLLHQSEPLDVHRRWLEENNHAILGSDLDNARDLMAARTAVHDVLVARWAESRQRDAGYRHPFAVVAHGGTGRRELTPCSDLDYALLFDDDLADNPFVIALANETRSTRTFHQQHGFAFEPPQFNLDVAPQLDPKDLNSFLDMRAVYDPTGLAEKFRKRIRASYDPFQHFLHVREFWRTRLDRSPACDRIDQFDIKNDALRVFQSGVWTLAGRDYQHSEEIYRSQVDPRDLDAYFFLLRIRGWMHLRKPDAPASPLGNHPQDVFQFDDFERLGEMAGPGASPRDRFDFANEVRARFLSARRRVLGFARGVIHNELRRGRPVRPGSPITLGPGGLFHAEPRESRTDPGRSRAALSLLHAAQRYGVPVDPFELQGTFDNAGDWLERVPEVAMLFSEPRGSLAGSFEFLSQIDGAEDRLFPGRRAFEASFDERVLDERTGLRGGFELAKLRRLEELLAADAPSLTTGDPETDSPAAAAVLLDNDHLTAVKLALKTKRLPVTPQDEIARLDEDRTLVERFSSGFSGVPLADYYRRYGKQCGFADEVLEITEFLIANRRAFKEQALEACNDGDHVQAFRERCGTEQHLHALYVFTCADRFEWGAEKSDPPRWFSIRELYLMTLRAFRNISPDAAALLRADGYDAESRAVIADFGTSFFGGLYGRHTNRFGPHLVRLASRETDVAKAAILHDGASVILGVAARDFPGLATSITGELRAQGVRLSQVHCFSARKHGLALDFFHLRPGTNRGPDDLPRRIEEAVAGQHHLESGKTLPKLAGTIELYESRPGRFRLRFSASADPRGVIHALCWKLFTHLGADIHGLSANITPSGPVITVQFSLPAPLDQPTAQRIIEEEF